MVVSVTSDPLLTPVPASGSVNPSVNTTATSFNSFNKN
jgi:hypothetical protein